MDFEFIRGDTFSFKFKLVDSADNILKLTGEDELYFTVKNNYNQTNIVLQKRYSNGDIVNKGDYYFITLGHEDTAKLKYGSYVYDIELVSGELVKTLILGNIELTDEVTFKANE